MSITLLSEDQNKCIFIKIYLYLYMNYNCLKTLNYY